MSFYVMVNTCVPVTPMNPGCPAGPGNPCGGRGKMWAIATRETVCMSGQKLLMLTRVPGGPSPPVGPAPPFNPWKNQQGKEHGNSEGSERRTQAWEDVHVVQEKIATHTLWLVSRNQSLSTIGSLPPFPSLLNQPWLQY